MVREVMGHFVSYQLLPIVFNMSLTASVVIVFVLLARLLLKKAPKVYSYALWAVVLFRLLCPISITSGFSLLALTDPPVLEATAQTNYVAYVPPNIVHTEFPQVQLPVPGVSDAINETLPQGQEQVVADPLEFPMALATLIWMLGILGLLAYSVISLILLRRRLVGAILLRENIYLADHVDAPFVVGVLHPKIYLPSALEEKEQEYIILHEQHHIRRFDHIMKMLSFAALCIHWFNPLVWVAFVLAGKDMEMSCDEAVLKKMGEHVRADYSASLLTLATGRRIIAGTPLAFGEGDTRDRIKNLLSWKKPKLWLTLMAAALCVTVIAACGANPKEENTSGSELTGQHASEGESQEGNNGSESSIGLVTVITPEDPNAEYGVIENGTLSNGIEYWIINPTPTDRIHMDLLSDSETFKVRAPIVNMSGDDGANVGDAIGAYPDEYISVRVGGLPSTMPTVNIGCHYVNGDNADWYPAVGADALVVFKIGSSGNDVQITTSTCESTSVTTSFTVSTSTINPAEASASDGITADHQAVPAKTVFGVDSNILQIGGPILEHYQQKFSGESVYWGVDQPDTPKNGDHRLGPMTYVGEMTLGEKTGVVYHMSVNRCSVTGEKTEWTPAESGYLVVTYNADGIFDQLLGEVSVGSDEATVKDIVEQVLQPHCEKDDKIGFLVSTTSDPKQTGYEVKNCSHGAVGKLDIRYEYKTWTELRCSLCGELSASKSDFWWGDWECRTKLVNSRFRFQ